MEYSGLSMALGAFLMGMTLSDSKYSLQIAANIEPYKGTLMSLFFVAVGMSLDIDIVMDRPGIIVQHVFLIMLFKIVVLFFLALAFGHSRSNAFRISFLLAQSGEFGFVLFSAALALGVIDTEVFAVGIAVISITMLLTPFSIKAGELFAYRTRGQSNPIGGELPEDEKFEGVVIAGYGRVGQMVGNILERSQIPYIAYDNDYETVAAERRKGKPVYYGDMSDADFLGAIKLAKTKLVVVSIDSPLRAIRVVSHIKNTYPGVKVFARAKDMQTKKILIRYGANWAMPEAMEGSLRMGAETLLAMNVPEEKVADLLAVLRKDDYSVLEPQDE
jgi:glutathione-regulated potassium-efflux system protein KefB